MDKASGGSVTRTVTYYPVAGAMRINSTLYYTLKDHLGSASIVTDSSGVEVGEQRYYPFGETRLTTGTIYTDKLFTGQREITGLGIYHYQARFYSPKIGRFLSADTIVPSYANPQSLNRYSYVLNSPLNYIDPTGHAYCDFIDNNNAEDCAGGLANSQSSDVIWGNGNNGGGGGDDEENIDPNPDGESSITITYDTQYIINNSFPYSLYSLFTADQWNTASLWLDYIALGIDALAGTIVLGHVAVGGLGGGPAGAGAGYLAGELNPAVRGLVTAGNVFASLATFAGLVASAKAGDLRLMGSLKLTQSQVSLTASASIPVSSIASGALTGAGWAAQPVSLSLPIQMTTVLNDHGVFNFPTLNFNTSISLP